MKKLNNKNGKKFTNSGLSWGQLHYGDQMHFGMLIDSVTSSKTYEEAFEHLQKEFKELFKHKEYKDFECGVKYDPSIHTLEEIDSEHFNDLISRERPQQWV